MLDSVSAFLQGPFFTFSCMLALLGVLRLLFFHLYAIIIAFYNSWKYTEKHATLIKDLLVFTVSHYSSLFSVSGIQVLKQRLPVFLLGILPFVIIDHQALLTRMFYIKMISLSPLLTPVVLILGGVFIVSRVWREVRLSPQTVGKISTILFWSLIFMVFLSGYITSIVNHPSFLKVFRLIHIGLGDLLILIIPFSRIGYFLASPFIRITSHIGIWSLPNAQMRDETRPYFLRLMEKGQ